MICLKFNFVVFENVKNLKKTEHLEIENIRVGILLYTPPHTHTHTKPNNKNQELKKKWTGQIRATQIFFFYLGLMLKFWASVQISVHTLPGDTILWLFSVNVDKYTESSPNWPEWMGLIK